MQRRCNAPIASYRCLPSPPAGRRQAARRWPSRRPHRSRALIKEARAVPEAQASVSERMDFISRALLGVRYRANTLIGGPQQPEQFVVRDDAFDCVTFCEFVLATALARDYRRV